MPGDDPTPPAPYAAGNSRKLEYLTRMKGKYDPNFIQACSAVALFLSLLAAG